MSCPPICQTQSNTSEIRNSIDCLQPYFLSENDAVKSSLPQMKSHVRGKWKQSRSFNARHIECRSRCFQSRCHALSNCPTVRNFLNPMSGRRWRIIGEKAENELFRY